MVKKREQKVQCGAWVDEGIADAVATWLATHPGKTRTDFLTEAVVGKLQRLKVVLPEHALDTKPEPKLGNSKRRGNKLLLTAWMNERLLAAVDMWIEKHPRTNRSDFLFDSIAGKLEESGVSILNVVSPAMSSPRRLRDEAYQGIRFLKSRDAKQLESGTNRERAMAKLNAELSACAEQMNKLIGKPRSAGGKLGARAKPTMVCLLEKRAEILAMLRDCEEVLQKGQLLESKCRAIGMKVPKW